MKVFSVVAAFGLTPLEPPLRMGLMQNTPSPWLVPILFVVIVASVLVPGALLRTVKLRWSVSSRSLVLGVMAYLLFGFFFPANLLSLRMIAASRLSMVPPGGIDLTYSLLTALSIHLGMTLMMGFHPGRRLSKRHVLGVGAGYAATWVLFLVAFNAFGHLLVLALETSGTLLPDLLVSRISRMSQQPERLALGALEGILAMPIPLFLAWGIASSAEKSKPWPAFGGILLFTIYHALSPFLERRFGLVFAVIPAILAAGVFLPWFRLRVRPSLLTERARTARMPGVSS